MDNKRHRHISLDSYKKRKIRMLKKEFMVCLAPEQEEYINNLKSEIAVDNYVRSLLR